MDTSFLCQQHNTTEETYKPNKPHENRRHLIGNAKATNVLLFFLFLTAVAFSSLFGTCSCAPPVISDCSSLFIWDKLQCLISFLSKNAIVVGKMKQNILEARTRFATRFEQSRQQDIQTLKKYVEESENNLKQEETTLKEKFAKLKEHWSKRKEEVNNKIESKKVEMQKQIDANSAQIAKYLDEKSEFFLGRRGGNANDENGTNNVEVGQVEAFLREFDEQAFQPYTQLERKKGEKEEEGNDGTVAVGAMGNDTMAVEWTLRMDTLMAQLKAEKGILQGMEHSWLVARQQMWRVQMAQSEVVPKLKSNIGNNQKLGESTFNRGMQIQMQGAINAQMEQLLTGVETIQRQLREQDHWRQEVQAAERRQDREELAIANVLVQWKTLRVSMLAYRKAQQELEAKLRKVEADGEKAVADFENNMKKQLADRELQLEEVEQNSNAAINKIVKKKPACLLHEEQDRLVRLLGLEEVFLHFLAQSASKVSEQLKDLLPNWQNTNIDGLKAKIALDSEHQQQMLTTLMDEIEAVKKAEIEARNSKGNDKLAANQQQKQPSAIDNLLNRQFDVRFSNMWNALFANKNNLILHNNTVNKVSNATKQALIYLRSDECWKDLEVELKKLGLQANRETGGHLQNHEQQMERKQHDFVYKEPMTTFYTR